MSFGDDSDIWEVDEEEYDEQVKFGDYVRECPNCKKTLTEDMDSCPFCGDIIFRYLTDGTFAPKKGLRAKIIVAIILLLILLAVLGFVLNALRLI